MTYRVQLSTEARTQLLEIDAWWTANRRGAPALLLEELDRAVSLLAAMPFAGRRYRRTGADAYRRLLLRKSGFHLYYLTDEQARLVVIAAVWNAKRGHGPTLV